MEKECLSPDRSFKKPVLEEAGYSTDYFKQYKFKEPTKSLSFKISKAEVGKESLVIDSSLKRMKCQIIGHSINIGKLSNSLRSDSSTRTKINKIDHKYKDLTILFMKEGFVLIFDYGVIFLWDFSEDEENFLIEKINKFTEKEIKPLNRLHSPGGFVYFYKKAECFELPSNKDYFTLESDNIREKISMSYAVAQSVILDHFENKIALTIEETKEVPINMWKNGNFGISNKEISKLVGIIFMRRNTINLHYDIFKTPDMFWNGNYDIQIIYTILRNYYNIDARLEILFKRMKILKDLYDIMYNEIKTQGKHVLEWIVVYLIVCEVIIALWNVLFKDILHLYK